MDDLRPWALWLSLAAVTLSLLVCLGSSLVTDPPPIEDRVGQLQAQPAPAGVDDDDVAALDAGEFSDAASDPPGLGVPALALVNGLLLVTVALATLPLVVGNKVTGSVQGVVSLLSGLAALILGIVLAVTAVAALLLMVGLLLSPPFGTLAYLAVFGFFDTDTSLWLLALVLVLQIAGAVLLVVAQQRFLLSKGLVLLVLSALLLTVLTTVLHSVVPGILVSITDAIAAIVAAVVAVLWGLAMLIGGIVSIVKLVVALRQAGGRQDEREA
ncbi:hypothetical protein [Cellulomonas sp. ATA003]|uniref:hypothetical protein n=1 Tax=Cellulomonas sp. ATA003 TaxID=3073064 RepID=UPI002872CD91|nr:hypothetical protein [Cellulomonas sp. ATA003]WNB87307.1 hypothetical protein REH70_09510 [Cellulomonas sp. ATA003]